MRKRIPGNDVRFRFNEIYHTYFTRCEQSRKPSRDTSFSKIINDSRIREALYRSYLQNFKYARFDKYYGFVRLKKKEKEEGKEFLPFPYVETKVNVVV